jgi:hypothetical protein
MAQPPSTGSGFGGRGRGVSRGRPVGIAPTSHSAVPPAASSISPSTRGRSRGFQLTSLSRQPASGLPPLNNQSSSSSNTIPRRGGQRGRGGSFTSRTNYVTPPVEAESPITEYLGAFIGDVTLDPDPTTYPVGAVEHVAPIASYSWLDKITPTIAVPGNAVTLLMVATN